MATKAVTKQEPQAQNGLPVFDGALQALDSDDDLTEIMHENLGDDGFRASDLTRVTFPREGTAWDVDGEMRTELRGVPLRQTVTRSFHINEYEAGSNDAPDCASVDGITGLPKDASMNVSYLADGRELSWGGVCARCPLNQWGSDIKGGKGKACREYRQIAFLEPDAALPVIVRLPPTQLGPWREFCVAVTKSRLRISQVVASLTISRSRDNVTSLAAVLVAVLPEEIAGRVADLSKSMNLLAAPQQIAAPSGYLPDDDPGPIDPDELPF